MALHLDHVTIAGPSLPSLEEAFREVGLEPEYGGPHSNGATHMALVGFDDGSYIELISLLDGEKESPLWHRQIVGGGGAAAWAVRTDDLGGEVERLRTLGIPVRGPVDYRRVRPDGVPVEWELAFPGQDPPGATFPFLIQDRTARDRRVTPSASVAGSELTGVGAVVLAVWELDSALARFRHCYGWSSAVEAEAPDFGARLAHVPGTPIVFARPLDGDDRLVRRLRRFGESPCAFLLRSGDSAASASRVGGARIDRHEWFGRKLFWIGPPQGGAEPALPPLTLGIIE